MNKKIVLFGIILCALFESCFEPKFKAEFYKDQHELLKQFVFERHAERINNLEESDKKKYMRYDSIDESVKSISNRFFDTCFLSGNFLNAKVAYVKLKVNYKNIFSDTNLFLPETVEKIQQLSKDSIKYNDFDLLFNKYVQLRCYLSSNLRACKSDAETYMHCKIVVDTIKTSDGTKMLHFYDEYLIPKGYSSLTISKVSKNGRNLLDKAIIEKKSYLSVFVLDDNRAGEIKVKAKVSYPDYSYEFWADFNSNKFY